MNENQIKNISPFMTVEECATYLRLNPQTLYRWSKRGKIPARKLNGKVVFHRGDVDAWSASKVMVAPQSPALTPFETARRRVRSLKTGEIRHTAQPNSRIQKRMG